MSSCEINVLYTSRSNCDAFCLLHLHLATCLHCIYGAMSVCDIARCKLHMLFFMRSCSGFKWLSIQTVAPNKFFLSMSSLGFMFENGLLLPFLEHGKDIMVLCVDKHAAHVVKQCAVVQYALIEIRKIIWNVIGLYALFQARSYASGSYAQLLDLTMSRCPIVVHYIVSSNQP